MPDALTVCNRVTRGVVQMHPYTVQLLKTRIAHYLGSFIPWVSGLLNLLTADVFPFSPYAIQIFFEAIKLTNSLILIMMRGSLRLIHRAPSDCLRRKAIDANLKNRGQGHIYFCKIGHVRAQLTHKEFSIDHIFAFFDQSDQETVKLKLFGHIFAFFDQSDQLVNSQIRAFGSYFLHSLINRARKQSNWSVWV